MLIMGAPNSAPNLLMALAEFTVFNWLKKVNSARRIFRAPNSPVTNLNHVEKHPFEAKKKYLYLYCSIASIGFEQHGEDNE